MPAAFKYASTNEAPVYKSVKANKGVTIVNRILMGTYVETGLKDGNFCKVITAGKDGWMNMNDLCDEMGLKVFVLDVGQGDGILMEIGGQQEPNKMKIILDAGPGNNMFNYLTKWQYTYLFNNNEPVVIDYLFVSHFDTDHYGGLIKILKDQRFIFKNVCHTGILKFATKGNQYNSGLGDLVEVNETKYLITLFSDLIAENPKSSYNRDITNFVGALRQAAIENRIGKVYRTGAGQTPVDLQIEGKPFKLDVLAPFSEKIQGQEAYPYWSDESKTINGNSLVVKITFGNRTFLLGGDLNAQAEDYLTGRYHPNNPFEVDVAKSCHHGSSDFTTDFMKLINPLATIISSGDNESYAHPRADAIGCSGKYARGARPLVFSTELARSADLKSKKILYGMINSRCNGKDIYISQMKEMQTSGDLWDSYKI